MFKCFIEHFKVAKVVKKQNWGRERNWEVNREVKREENKKETTETKQTQQRKIVVSVGIETIYELYLSNNYLEKRIIRNFTTNDNPNNNNKTKIMNKTNKKINCFNYPCTKAMKNFIGTQAKQQ